MNVTPRGEHAREAQTQTRTPTEQRAGKRTPAGAPNPKHRKANQTATRGGGKAEQREREHVQSAQLPLPTIDLLYTVARSLKANVKIGCPEFADEVSCIYSCEQLESKDINNKALSPLEMAAPIEMVRRMYNAILINV